MPIDYKKYPDDWKEIRIDILTRAGNKCEKCGVRNHALGARDLKGKFHTEDEIAGMSFDQGDELFGDQMKLIRIVLTVAHLDQDIKNNDPGNLEALCQKCHLDHDRGDNLIKANQTRLMKKQQPEFNFEEMK